MALTATVYTFDVAVNDVDRGVYETLAIKAARHPSESEDYLLTRVLAYCLEYTCLLYTSPSPRDRQKSRMPSSA